MRSKDRLTRIHRFLFFILKHPVYPVEDRSRSARRLRQRSPGRHPMEIKKIGVVGCGLLGAGLDRIKQSLATGVRRGKLSENEQAATLGQLRGVTSLDELGDRDLVIEAITENLQAKQQIFSGLDAACPPHTILASNTSS